MSVVGDFLDGAAAAIGAAGIGVYDPARIWTTADTDTAVVIGVMPSEPDAVIVLQAYLLGGDDPAHPTTTINLQVRTRTPGLDTHPLLTLDGAVYDLFHGATDLTWGSVTVTQLMHKSSLALGQDSNNRLMRSSNFTADCDVPSTANRSY